MEDCSKSKKKRIKRKEANGRKRECEKNDEKIKAIFVKKLKKKCGTGRTDRRNYLELE